MSILSNYVEKLGNKTLKDFITIATQPSVFFINKLIKFNSPQDLSLRLEKFVPNYVFMFEKEWSKSFSRQYNLFRDKVRYTVNYSFAHASLILVINEHHKLRSNLIRYFRKNMYNIYEVADEDEIFLHMHMVGTVRARVGHNTYQLFPQLPDQTISNVMRQASTEVCLRYTIDSKCAIIGYSADLLLQYMVKGYLPRIYDPSSRFRSKQQEIEMAVKNSSKKYVIHNGQAKLIYLLLYALYDAIFTHNARNLVYIGFWPMKYISYRSLDMIATAHNIKIHLIDPRVDDLDVELTFTSIRIIKDIVDFNQPARFTDEFGYGCYVIDDSYLEDNFHDMVDIKLVWANRIKSFVLLKYSPKWHKSNFVPKSYELFVPPYAPDEIRLGLKPNFGIISDSAIKSMMAKQTKIKEHFSYFELKTAMGSRIMENQYKRAFMSHLISEDTTYNGIFSFNGIDDYELEKLPRIARERNAFVLMSQPYKETEASVRYGDVLRYPYEIESKSNFYAINFGTILALSDQTAVIWKEETNLAMTSVIYMSDIEKLHLEEISSNAEAKMFSGTVRAAGLDNNWGFTRLMDFVNLEPNAMLKSSKIYFMRDVVFNNYIFKTGKKYDMSGHLTNYLVLALQYKYPIAFKSWITMILRWKDRLRNAFFRDLLDPDVRLDMQRTGMHTVDELMLSLYYIYLVLRNNGNSVKTIIKLSNYIHTLTR